MKKIIVFSLYIFFNVITEVNAKLIIDDGTTGCLPIEEPPIPILSPITITIDILISFLFIIIPIFLFIIKPIIFYKKYKKLGKDNKAKKELKKYIKKYYLIKVPIFVIFIFIIALYRSYTG